jgi:hypothetical protein
MNPSATAQYRFFVLTPGSSSYQEIRSWGEGSLSWTNTTGQSGRLTFLVYARDSRNSSAYESYKTTVTLVGEVCQQVTSFTATPGAGGLVELSAEATGTDPGATMQYKFFVLTPGSSAYQEIRSWGESAMSWTNTTGAAGRLTFLVYARDSRNLSAYEAYKTAAALVGEVCQSVTSFTATPGAGGLVELSALATGTDPGATMQYKFFVLPPGSSSYQEIRSWGEGTLSWTNTTGQSGRFTFLVYARDSRNSSPYEAYKTASTLVGEACNSVTSFTATPGPGGLVALNAEASCTDPYAPVQYKFFVLSPGSSAYQEIRSWGDGAMSWMNNTLKTGTFTFLVYARDGRNLSVYEAYNTRSAFLNE